MFMEFNKIQSQAVTRGVLRAVVFSLARVACDSNFTGQVSNSNKKNNPLVGVKSVEGELSLASFGMDNSQQGLGISDESCSEEATVYLTLFAQWDGSKFSEVKKRYLSVKADSRGRYAFLDL